MIEVTSLTKQFGHKKAVDDLSFTVNKGEVLGFLGPNGAGKSTTMRVVTGFLPPTKGEVNICGISMVDQPTEAKKKIGYLPESAPLYDGMSVRGFLRFCADMCGLSGSATSLPNRHPPKRCRLPPPPIPALQERPLMSPVHPLMPISSHSPRKSPRRTESPLNNRQ